MTGTEITMGSGRYFRDLKPLSDEAFGQDSTARAGNTMSAWASIKAVSRVSQQFAATLVRTLQVDLPQRALVDSVVEIGGSRVLREAFAVFTTASAPYKEFAILEILGHSFQQARDVPSLISRLSPGGQEQFLAWQSHLTERYGESAVQRELYTDPEEQWQKVLIKVSLSQPNDCDVMSIEDGEIHSLAAQANGMEVLKHCILTINSCGNDT